LTGGGIEASFSFVWSKQRTLLPCWSISTRHSGFAAGEKLDREAVIQAWTALSQNSCGEDIFNCGFVGLSRIQAAEELAFAKNILSLVSRGTAEA
jgi:hypothetical protein